MKITENFAHCIKDSLYTKKKKKKLTEIANHKHKYLSRYYHVKHTKFLSSGDFVVSTVTSVQDAQG